MKKTLTLTLAIVAANFIHAQDDGRIFYFDNAFNPVPENRAVVFGIGDKNGAGGMYMVRYFNSNKQLLMLAHYTDSTLTILNGRKALYYPDGAIKELYAYVNNKLNGQALKLDDMGNIADSATYRDDRLQYRLQRVYGKDKLKNRIVYNQTETDSVNNTLTDLYFDPSGNLSRKYYFVGNKGLETQFDSLGNIKSTDSVFTRTKQEANIPRGSSWRNYLERNLRADVPVRNGAPRGQYTVIVQFIINEDGKVDQSSVKALTGKGYGMEEEVVRIIKKSGNWQPAIMYGRAIKAYRKQPVTFAVQ